MNNSRERIDSTMAELRSIADQLGRHYDRVGALIEPFADLDHDDVTTALHEAERQIGIAQRTVERSIRTIDTRA